MSASDSVDRREHEKLKAFSNAQTNTIIELSKKIKLSQEEIDHLKKLLEGSVPLIKESVIDTGGNDQEQICKLEINKLRHISLDRELTLEEVKKLDILVKILKDPKAPKVDDSQVKATATEDLLNVIKFEGK